MGGNSLTEIETYDQYLFLTNTRFGPDGKYAQHKEWALRNSLIDGIGHNGSPVLTDKGNIALVKFQREQLVTVVDPPSGWLYGFPKEYDGKQELSKVLLDAGYPKDNIDFALRHMRFWKEQKKSVDKQRA